MAVVGKLAHTLGVVYVNPLIETVPRKAQDTVAKADHLVGEVGRNLFHQGDGVLLRLLVGDFFAARFVFDGAGNGF